MTSPPSFDPSRLPGRLRHQLLAIWLGSILAVLVLVGLVLATLMEDFQRREARRDIGVAVTQFRHALLDSATELLRHGDLLAQRQQLVATVNMVDRYQDVTDYRPLVFDGEKRVLAQLLADRVAATEITFAAAYDSKGRPMAFANDSDIGATATYHSVADGVEILLAQADAGWQPTEVSQFMRSAPWGEPPETGDVLYRSFDGRLVLELFVPVERNLPNAPSMTVGYVQLAKEIDADFLMMQSNRSGVALGVALDGRQVGPLEPIELAGVDPIPDVGGAGECPCAWIDADTMTVGVTSMDLDDGARAVFLAGASDKAASAIVRFYQMASIMVLVAVAGIVAPGGLVLLNKTIMTPLSRLLHGVEALRQGRPIRLTPQFKNNEFGTLAKGFDAMADSIADREDELRRTIDQLAHSNSELERFAVIAAHDLQEPLRMVASYTQLLKRRYRGQLDKDADEFIDYAVEGAERMKTLIQSLLEYSRVEGDQDAFRPVDCGQVVDGILRDLHRSIEETGAIVEAVDLPTVNGNAIQLGQVFQNLIANALKFRRGTPRIAITARREGNDWVFAVADSGIGIPAEYMPQLFSLFRRLHTRKEYPGSGLGLAIARRIVERHGGRIWAKSTEGEGTTILFTLPA